MTHQSNISRAAANGLSPLPDPATDTPALAGGEYHCPDCDGAGHWYSVARVSGEAFDADYVEQTCETCDGLGVVDYPTLTPARPVKSPEQQRLDLARAHIQIARAFGVEPDEQWLTDARLYDLGDGWKGVAL